VKNARVRSVDWHLLGRCKLALFVPEATRSAGLEQLMHNLAKDRVIIIIIIIIYLFKNTDTVGL